MGCGDILLLQNIKYLKLGREQMKSGIQTQKCMNQLDEECISNYNIPWDSKGTITDRPPLSQLLLLLIPEFLFALLTDHPSFLSL